MVATLNKKDGMLWGLQKDDELSSDTKKYVGYASQQSL